MVCEKFYLSYYKTVNCIVPSGAPLDVSGSQVNSTALIFSWGPPSPEKLNGVLRNYILKILVAESAEEYELETNSTESQLTVTGLHPHYAYTCAVAAVTVGGGPFSKPITTMTPEDGKYDLTAVNIMLFS